MKSTAVQMDPDSLSGMMEEKMELSEDRSESSGEEISEAESVWKERERLYYFYYL